MFLPPSFVCVTVPPLTLAPEKTPLVWASAASTIEAAENTSRVAVMKTETRKRVSGFERSMSFLLVEALLQAHRLDAGGGGRFQMSRGRISILVYPRRERGRVKTKGSRLFVQRPSVRRGGPGPTLRSSLRYVARVAAQDQRAARGPGSPPRRRCTMKRHPGHVWNSVITPPN